MLNIILDESGNTTYKGEEQKKGPKSRIMGALIFNQNMPLLEAKLKEYIKGNSSLSMINLYNSASFKYEKLKKLQDCDIIFDLILDFLISQGCYFYYHPIYDYNKKIPEKINGIKSTKLILGCNLDIIANLILVKRKNKEDVGSRINVFYDKEDNNLLECAININSPAFIIYPLYIKDKIDLENFYEFYTFDIKRIHGTNILHVCTDIIAGICNDNYNKHIIEQSNLFRKILKNKFCDIVTGEFT